MVIDHIVMLGVVMLVAWLLLRWGTLIFLGYAFYHFCLSEWGYAIAALVFACVIEMVKGALMFWERLTGSYNGPWR